MVSTYNSGKLVLVSCREDRLFTRVVKLPRPMGLASAGHSLAIATQGSLLLHKFRRHRPGRPCRYRLAQTFATGRVDCHDVAFGQRGLYFVNTRYNCIARATARCRFLHCWRPPFISQIVPQDRCHLNGLGMRAGKPALATAFAETDTKKGWRSVDRFQSGVLLDIQNNLTLMRGLCMPHSPRFYEGRWWLCNSGQGSLCVFDPVDSSLEEVCQLPGFTRGLCFQGDRALVGLSRIRKEHVLDTPLLRDRGTRPRAGVALVDCTEWSANRLTRIRPGRQ